MRLILYGLNHKTAAVAIRECMSMAENEKNSFYEEIQDCVDIDGAVVLSTCNRTEFYFSAVNYHNAKIAAKKIISKYSGHSFEELSQHIYYKKDGDLVRHLFAVTSGLDSMVLGETQILGQVQEAYREAKEKGSTNTVLNKLFQHSIMTSKLVRNNTFLDRRPVSVSTTAIDLAKKRIKNFSESSVLLIGAGSNSELALKYLKSNGIENITIVNRTLEKAKKMSKKYNCKYAEFEDIGPILGKVNLVVSSTSAPGLILKKDEIKDFLSGRREEIVFMDLAVPRDIDEKIASLKNTFLIDLDVINSEVEGNIKKRIIEAEKARVILHSESRKFIKWKESLAVVPVIVDLREKAEHIKDKELGKAFRRLGNISEREKHIIETMASNIVNTFLHSASENIKDIDVKDGMLSAYVLKKLFELDNLEISLDGSIFENEEKTAN
ncbi:MAG: glutamyl-tRNA reductase [Eubacteriales bacterium]|jgi:glutamyl-tRNA reductase|nr:glutamyl-tRNA reductase [Eubacteriales bacterium]NCC80872.1 glutamyl-tRNA reductase [Clostridia bacterium]